MNNNNSGNNDGGDCAKLREALKEIRARIVYLYGRTDGTFDPPALKEVCEIADEALAKPPRNCDVGSVKKQFERYRKFCKSSRLCSKCEIGIHSGSGCYLYWAQMPYRKGSNYGQE